METNNLFHTLNQKVRLLSKDLNEELQKHNLYNSQWTILYILSKKGPMSLTEIWQYLQVEPPTVTRTITRMEASNWVKRWPGKDKRERIVELTAEAKEKLPSIKETVKQYEQQSVSELTKEEQQQLLELLQKLGKKKE